jgi:hypothetical protein
MSPGRHLVVVSNDEVSQYRRELSLLLDRLDVCEEVREGYYSDEARVCDLFSFLDRREDVDARVAALELPGVTPSTHLIDALRSIRQIWAVN